MPDIGGVVPAVVRRNRLVKFGLAIAVVVALIAVAGGVAYAETTAQLEATAQDDYTALAEQGATELGAWQRERTAELVVVATDDAFAEGTAGRHLDDAITDASADVIAYHYVDRDGTVRETTDRGGAVETFEHLPAALPSAADDPVRTDPYGEPGEARLAFVAPVDGDGLLVMETDLQLLVDNAVAPTDGSHVTLVDAGGDVAVADDPNVVGESYAGVLADDPFADRVGFYPDTATPTADGTHLVAYASVPESDLAYALHVPTSEAYALSTAISRYLLLIVGIAVVGFAAVGVGIARPTVRELDRLGERARALESGDLDVDLEATTDDEIGRLYESFDAMRVTLRERIEEAEAERERAREARRESDAFADRLETRAAAYGDAMAAAADGDLTTRIDVADDDPAALREVATAFNDAMSELEATVAEVEAFAAAVADATESVTERTDEVARAGREASEGVADISADAERQSRRLAEVAGEMEDMSATIQEVAASADEVSTVSRQAAALSDDGREAADAAVDRLHDAESRSETAAEAVDRLEAEMDRVTEMAATISEVAEETHVLALNASIEAARADAGGEGFAVVAEEVKALAEETQDSATEVERLVATLQDRTDETVAEMRAIREGVLDGVDAVEEAADALEAIHGRVGEADDGIQEISDAMDTQAGSVNEVTGATDELAEISERTTEEATAVADAVDQQATTLADVSGQADDLATRAGRLAAVVEKFEVDREAATGADATGGDAATAADGDGPTTAVDDNDPTTAADGGEDPEREVAPDEQGGPDTAAE